jgi:hypothetical protein
MAGIRHKDASQGSDSDGHIKDGWDRHCVCVNLNAVEADVENLFIVVTNYNACNFLFCTFPWFPFVCTNLYSTCGAKAEILGTVLGDSGQPIAKFDVESLGCFDRLCSNGIILGALRRYSDPMPPPPPPLYGSSSSSSSNSRDSGWEFIELGDTTLTISPCCGCCLQGANDISPSKFERYPWVTVLGQEVCNTVS